MTDIAACFSNESLRSSPMTNFEFPSSARIHLKAFRWTWQSPDTSNRWGCSSMGGVFGGVVAKGCEQNPESFKDASESEKNSGNK